MPPVAITMPPPEPTIRTVSEALRSPAVLAEEQPQPARGATTSSVSEALGAPESFEEEPPQPARTATKRSARRRFTTGTVPVPSAAQPERRKAFVSFSGVPPGITLGAIADDVTGATDLCSTLVRE